MADVLIIYASRDGHTRAIAQRMQQRLAGRGAEVRLVDVNSSADLDPSAFPVVAVGGSVVYGKHDPRLAAFLIDNAERMGECQTAFFSVNLIARKAEKRTIEGNVYVRKFLDALPLTPDHVEIIAGKLDYPSYGFFDRIMIQLTMKFTDGPTDRSTVIDYTDYDQVDAFADRLQTMAQKASQAS
ncbi:MAG: menaquinone-dependent protoporphyrinogen IX dehydrogenase [Wenzhouxiangella sp.]|jgi:menaquinone-dependent protoporphyrinogen oxidase|nr:menaquinone-dependent protoporphyrinogen IX dehydrogenase [Wenzhouxiangella sp.]